MAQMLFPRVGFIATVVALSGCVTITTSYLPKRIELSEPPLDSIKKAYVGDDMIRQGTYLEHDAIYLRSEVRVGTVSSYTIRPGYYVKEGENDESEFFLPSPYGNGGLIIRSPISDPVRSVQAYKDKPSLCILTVFSLSVCKDNVAFERTKQPTATVDSFQQTLIYSGKFGDKLRIGYREFSNNFARPAFSNDVEYDLGESRVIGYKGARLEVIEATNQYIRYKVLSYFNKPLH